MRILVEPSDFENARELSSFEAVPGHDMAQDEYDLQVVMGLRGMIAPPVLPASVSNLKLNDTEDGFAMTVDGAAVPAYLATALHRAGLLRHWERVVGIVRLPDSLEISITVRPISTQKPE